LRNAAGEIEVIVVFDGQWPAKMLNSHERLITIHHGRPQHNFGMRASINKGVLISSGEYVMKVDEHCSFDRGYDIKLKADCEDNWLITPRRYNLDADNWQRIQTPMFDNMSFKFPHLGLYNCRSWTYLRKDILIDDCMAMQGSCYFMSRKHWDWLGGLDELHYGKFHYEPQEICLKTWLGGGRVITNKKTWYAHWHRRAKGYNFSKAQYSELNESKNAVVEYAQDFWLNDRWDKRVHNFKWLVEKFRPVPYWPENWRQKLN